MAQHSQIERRPRSLQLTPASQGFNQARPDDDPLLPRAEIHLGSIQVGSFETLAEATVHRPQKAACFGDPTSILLQTSKAYGEGMALHGADALVVNISQTPGVVILEYEVQGNAVGSGKLYENRFISVVTIEDRKIVGWRDYMDSLAAMSSLT
jgi:hypothetical protein